jgi:hypothetical protein
MISYSILDYVCLKLRERFLGRDQLGESENAWRVKETELATFSNQRPRIFVTSTKRWKNRYICMNCGKTYSKYDQTFNLIDWEGFSSRAFPWREWAAVEEREQEHGAAVAASLDVSQAGDVGVHLVPHLWNGEDIKSLRLINGYHAGFPLV